jgi:hypothetical protein
VPCLLDLSLVDECRERACVALDAMRDPEMVPVSPYTRMELLSAYAVALAYTAGPTQAVHDAWSEVHALALAAGAAEYELRALWGRWSASQQAGNARDALLWSRRLCKRVQALDHAAAKALALGSEAAALHYAGAPNAARRRLERMLNGYEHDEDRRQTIGWHVEHGIIARTTLARVRWTQGAPDDALRLAVCTYDMARDVAPGLVIGQVLVEGLLPIALLTGANDLAEQGIAALRGYASRTGSAIWLACCDCYDEYLKSSTGAAPSRLSRFRATLDALHDTGYRGPMMFQLAQYAHCLGAQGHFDEAMATVDAALRRCHETGERWIIGRLEQVRAELIGVDERFVDKTGSTGQASGKPSTYASSWSA